MRKRRFINPDAVSSQLALVVDSQARVHNRQVAEKAAGKKIRRGPGRPAYGVKSATAITHQPRPKLSKKQVMHLTVKLRRGLPSLRRERAFAAVRRSFFKYSRGEGFRLVHFSVQSNHLHLIAEADSKPALSRAMQKLGISLAKRLDRLWKGAGRIYKERYHQRILTTPLAIRNALLYVIQNAKHHDSVIGEALDPFSSGAHFDGFAELAATPAPKGLIAEATSWLLTKGWRRRGLIRLSEVPKKEAVEAKGDFARQI